jgi:hypothetical protein
MTVRNTSHTSLNPLQLVLCLFAKKMQERKRNSNSESLAQPVDFIELSFTFFKKKKHIHTHTHKQSIGFKIFSLRLSRTNRKTRSNEREKRAIPERNAKSK